MTLDPWDGWVIVCSMIALAFLLRYVGKRLTDRSNAPPPADDEDD